MIDNIDNESRTSLVSYRIERAHKTLSEVAILFDNGLFSTAVNRLYYAVYYAAVALLVSDGINANTHSGVRSMWGYTTFESVRSVGKWVIVLCYFSKEDIAAIMMILLIQLRKR